VDVTDVILDQHAEQRRLFLALHELRGDSDTARVATLWGDLARVLEVHAAAEEEHFYPMLLEVRGEEAADETEDAIKDHGEIRDAIAESRRHEPGTTAWWDAVVAAEKANSDHMAEEERDDLADFRRYADLDLRHETAVALLSYEAENHDGVGPRDLDPEEVSWSRPTCG
jgi:hypothetical protein